MNHNEKKSSHTARGLIIGSIALAILIGVMLFVWMKNRPQLQQGSKSITVLVVDDSQATKTYTLRTDAEYLREALDQIDGLELEGEEGDYGLYLKTVNGLRADYALDHAYWSIYLNGEYCMYGIEEQPVLDQDVFTIQYERAQ